MGEFSKRIGDVGEDIVIDFLAHLARKLLPCHAC
jgi:hypothetical protein